jgi:valyl-tRNA synthetase
VALPSGELFVPLEGILDVEAEKQRLTKEMEKAQGFAAQIQKKLANEKFVASAPEAVVEGERNKLATQMGIVEKNRAALEELG